MEERRWLGSLERVAYDQNMNPGARQAGWWLADYLYAGWCQLRGFLSRRDAQSFRSGSLAPILILPGVYEYWHFMLPLARELHGLGHPVHVVEALRNNRVPVPVGAQIAAAYLSEHDLRDVVIVAHSKGGLIGKYMMSFGDSPPRVDRMVAIATPFGGSRYAQLFPGRELRIFRPLDETLALLTGAPRANTRIVSVFASFDPHIPEGSELAGARNLRIDTGGHFRVLIHPDARAEVARVAAGTAAPGQGAAGAGEGE